MARKNRYGLAGQRALITGAARGIGLGIAEAFAAEGASLILLDRDDAALAAAAEKLSARATVATHAVDLGDAAAVAQFAAEVRDGGELRVLVNNAGIEYPTPIDAPPRIPPVDVDASWSRLVDNNVSTIFRLTRALLPAMAAGSAVINQASIWGKMGVPHFSAYVASKHAIIGLTRSLAWELGPRGIRVNAVCPGWVKTEAALRSALAMAETHGRSVEEELQHIVAAQAMPRLLEPADIAGLYLFLASDDARAITGESVVAALGEVMS